MLGGHQGQLPRCSKMLQLSISLCHPCCRHLWGHVRVCVLVMHLPMCTASIRLSILCMCLLLRWLELHRCCHNVQGMLHSGHPPKASPC